MGHVYNHILHHSAGMPQRSEHICQPNNQQTNQQTNKPTSKMSVQAGITSVAVIPHCCTAQRMPYPTAALLSTHRAYGREYISAEEQAHSRGAGIWQGSFTEPAVWRKQERVAALNASLARNSQLGTAPAGPATAPASPATAPATTQPLASAYVSNSSAGSHGTLQDNVGNSSHTTLPEAGASSSGSGLHSAAPADKPIAVVAGVSGGRTQGAQSGLLPVGNCNGPLVKGNINSKGQKIYHTVTSGQYMRVEIDESKGERYFCSEAEAEAAGWRAAQR